MEVSGAGIIRKVVHCDIFGMNFRIFSVFQGRTWYSKNIIPLEIPNLTNTLTEQENKIINFDLALTFDTLKSLQNELADESIPVKLKSLIKQLEHSHNMRTYWKSVKHGAIGTTMGIMILIICILLCRFRIALGQYYRQWQSRRMIRQAGRMTRNAGRRPRDRTSDETSLELQEREANQIRITVSAAELQPLRAVNTPTENRP